MKTIIEIEIFNIKIKKTDESSGYFDFDYQAKINGNVKTGNYDGKYSSQSSSTIRNSLKKGYAIELAIIEIFGF